MAKEIKLVDFLSAGNLLGKNRDANMRMFDSVSKDTEGLRVKIQATNSGALVNGRVYKGIHMAEAVTSWTQPYQRPVLTHHADGGGMFSPPPVDPKGRVESAEFTQLRKGRAFENDFKRPDNNGGQGSGYITVEAFIPDMDAIQKILDGRYQTVSSSQTTTEMTCSICQQDWFQDMCEHTPGQVHAVEVGNGKNKETREFMCYGITGPLVYRELSFVNIPAQVNAKVLGVLEPDAQDSLVMRTQSDHNAIRGMTLCDAEGHILSDLTNMKEIVMSKSSKTFVEMPGTTDEDLSEDLEAKPIVHDIYKEIDKTTPETSEDTLEIPADSKAEDNSDVVPMSDEEFALANVAKSIKDNGLWLDPTDQVPVFDGATVETEESDHSHLVLCQKTEDGNLVGRTYATIGEVADHSHVVSITEDDFSFTRDADSGNNHTHEFKVWEAKSHDAEDLDALVVTLEEAASDEESKTLSAEQREMLKANDFCGPNKSFPASDLFHVGAIRQLIGSYKSDAATKVRISQSMVRKAKKLDITVLPNKPVVDVTKVTEADLDDATHRDEELLETQAALAGANIKLKSLETSLTEKSQEVAALEDDLALERSARSSALANTLTIIRMVVGKSDCSSIDSPEKFEDKVKSYAGRTPESLWDAVSDLLPEVDLALRSIRRSKSKELISAPRDGKENKDPIMRSDKTNDFLDKPRKKLNGANQLEKDLEI